MTWDIFIKLRIKVFRINDRETIDKLYCSIYDDLESGILHKRQEHWNETIVDAYHKYGVTYDEDFPFLVTPLNGDSDQFECHSGNEG